MLSVLNNTTQGDYNKQFVCVPLPDYSELCENGSVALCNKTYSSEIESLLNYSGNGHSPVIVDIFNDNMHIETNEFGCHILCFNT